jgi:hypothetical protein
MARISTYEVVPVPKLADKLIGTSVGGEIEDITYNFTLLELLNLFIPNIPSSSLQGVLDNGNTATQDIILYGTIYTTNLEVTNTATLLDSYLNGDTNVLGALYDINGSQGLAGQVLTSTGTGVDWVTLPPIFTPTLQQVLTQGNTANLDIILTSNIQALDINIDTATVNNNITIDGTITDGYSSVGTSNQVLSSTGTDIKWVNLPVYSATSPLFLDSLTGIFSIQQSSGTQSGYLSASDWITFNGKQNAGNYITALTGEATATGPGSVAITLSNPAVTGKVLTGLSITGGSISAADSILSAFGKVQGQLNALVGGVMFKGVWNAFTNTPTLTSSIGTQGWYYIVDVAGTTNLNGITDWQVGDWAIFNGSTWNKIDNTDLVTSVNGQVGAVSLTTDDISEGSLNLYFTDTRARNSVSATTPLAYNNISGVFSIQVATSSQDGYLTSTDWTTFNSKQNALSGTGIVKSTSGTITYITDNSSNWNTAYNDSIVSAAVTGTSTKTLTLNQQDGGTITASWSDADTGLTSVGLSMPVAFSVANTPLTANGTLAVTAVGSASQYIRGDGQLATFPSSGGGGSSVYYYLNGSIAASVATYKQMSNTAVIGGGTDFNLAGNGLIAQFLTDVGNPNRLEIPGGAWNFEMFFSMSSSGGTPKFYVELLKYDGVVFTLISSGSINPEGITSGTTTDLYLTSLGVPTTTLLLTDRLAVRVYIVNNSGGRTATLHTEDSNLCQIITTFSSGVSSLNGLTDTTQYFAVGTSGTDFAINSLINTHTFNLPTSSAINRGALSSADWTTFNSKANALSGTTNTVPKFTSGTTIGDSNIKDNGNAVTINATAGANGALQVGNYGGNILMNTTSASGGLIFQNTSSSNKLWDFSSYNNDINFNESGIATPVMTLQAGGNVGIKQISPSYQLDVNGTFHNTGVVTLGNLAGLGSRMVIADSSGVLSTQAITTGTVTAVTASSPLVSSGGNTPDISIPAATTSVNGYLSSTDWTTFNNKQPSGSYITSLTGEATGTGPGATSVTLNNASVTGKILTGVNITGGTVVATDTMLTAFGKLQNQINGLIGGSIYQGTWDASTNTPTLTSSVGTQGYYYIVSVAGTTNLNGITDWFVGDWAIFNGGVWQQVDNTDSVVSVNGQTGAVSLTTDNISEGTTNLYFTNLRARAAITLTTTGTSGASTYNSTTGALNIPQYQDVLTNPVTGTGGANFVPKFTSASIIANSQIYDNGTGVGVGITTLGAYFDVNGTGRFSGQLTLSSTLSNGTYTYTLPSATGTLALTSAIPTNAVGASGFWTSGFLAKINGTYTVTSSIIQDDGGSHVAIGYLTNPALYMLDVNGTGKFVGQLTLGSTITNGTYTYTLPSATGTLALTSALSGYLPLTGGTLTGALGGTSASFSGNVAINTTLSAYALDINTANGVRVITSGDARLILYSTATLGLNWSLLSYTSGNFVIGRTGVSDLFTFTAAGSLTLGNTAGTGTGALYAGAATFSSSVTAGGTVHITGAGSPTTGAGLEMGYGNFTAGRTTITSYNRTGAAYIGNDYNALDYIWYTSGSPKMTLTNGGNVLIGTTTDVGYKLDVNGTGRFSGNLTVQNATSGRYFNFVTDSSASYLDVSHSLNVRVNGASSLTTALTLASTGAATFSSRVNINGATDDGVSGLNVSGSGRVFKFSGATTGTQYFDGANSGANLVWGMEGSAGAILYTGSLPYAAVFGNENNYPVQFGTNNAIRMTVTSGGNVLIGTTTDNGQKFRVNGGIESFGSSAQLRFGSRTAANTLVWYSTGGTTYFFNDASSNIASINESTGAYVPLSDINKKKDFEQSTVGLNAILGLKPTLYRMKSDDETSDKHLGFIAQEVKKFIPQAYVESGDFIGLNDRPIIAALVKAIQEQQEQIKELQSQIQTLENK